MTNEVLDTFLPDGKQPNPGDGIAAAFYRQGQRIFSRSFKYHRSRGLLCAAGRRPNCRMNVDGIPNVRACVTLVRDGMRVRAQNAYPSLDNDWLSAAQWFDWLMPVGWYDKTFRPRHHPIRRTPLHYAHEALGAMWMDLEQMATYTLELFPRLHGVRVMDVGWGTYGFKASPMSGKCLVELIASGKTPP